MGIGDWANHVAVGKDADAIVAGVEKLAHLPVEIGRAHV